MEKLTKIKKIAKNCSSNGVGLPDLEHGKNMHKNRSLDEIEELLDPARFFRVNRQHLANLEAIESYQSDEWSKLHLRLKPPLKETLVVSKEKAAEFRRWFG